MDKKKKEIIVMIVLVGAFVALFFSTFNRTKGKLAILFPKLNKWVPYNTVPVKDIAATVAVKKIHKKELVWGRDPFQLNEATEAGGAKTEGPLKLMGITYDDKGQASMAVINDEIVKPSSKVGKFTVKEILKNKVVVNDGGKDVILTLE